MLVRCGGVTLSVTCLTRSGMGGGLKPCGSCLEQHELQSPPNVIGRKYRQLMGQGEKHGPEADRDGDARQAAQVHGKHFNSKRIRNLLGVSFYLICSRQMDNDSYICT